MADQRRFPPPWRAEPVPGRLHRPGRQWAGACLRLQTGERGRGAAGKNAQEGRWRTHQRERTMQLSGSLPARRAKIRAMSSAVPMLLPPTNVRSPHTRTTVSQVLQACAGVTESAESIAIPSRAAVPSAEPIARVLDMFFAPLSESKERNAPWPFWRVSRWHFSVYEALHMRGEAVWFLSPPCRSATKAAGATFLRAVARPGNRLRSSQRAAAGLRMCGMSREAISWLAAVTAAPLFVAIVLWLRTFVLVPG
jgi:hypothetical protein